MDNMRAGRPHGSVGPLRELGTVIGESSAYVWTSPEDTAPETMYDMSTVCRPAQTLWTAVDADSSHGGCSRFGSCGRLPYARLTAGNAQEDSPAAGEPGPSR